MVANDFVSRVSPNIGGVQTRSQSRDCDIAPTRQRVNFDGPL